MKPLKMFLSVICLAVAVFATAKFFSQNAVEITASEIVNCDYTPSVSTVGTIVASSYASQSQSNIPAVAPNNNVYVTTLISESGISDVKVGQKAAITGSGFGEKTYTATVTKIGDKAQKNTSLSGKAVAVEVTLKIDKPDSTLKSGFTAKTKIFTDSQTSKTVVPYAAVMQDKSGEYVFVCVDGKAQKRYIKTGIELENGYEVLEGLSLKESVVTSPKLIKNDGQRVAVVGEVY